MSSTTKIKKKTKLSKKIIIEQDNEIDNPENTEKPVNTEKKEDKCDETNLYTVECNQLLKNIEKKERKELSKVTNDSFLYPNLNDPNFNIKISQKKEFNETQYDGTIYNDIKAQADKLSKLDFQLQPHQLFVKNFLSSPTPFNSLLLFHGLGTGKTCSAIGISEEMRDYMKQVGLNKRIIVVASENIQDNFKLQLFDERKLKQVNGIWDIKGCIGNKLLKEINPTNIKGLSKEKIIQQVNNIIRANYLFLGYGQFANYIIKTLGDESYDPNSKIINKNILRRLQSEFNDRLIIIDEIHNVRIAEENNELKKVAIYLELLVKGTENMRLLFLSATPMYNNSKEIIWLLNILNMNDKRSKIDGKSVFDKNGNLKKEGAEILREKSTGYVSFIKGENPYTFPYRVYPNIFAPNHTFPFIKYPKFQMNLKEIPDNERNRILNLYLTNLYKCNNCGNCQYCIYKYIIKYLRFKKTTIISKKGQVREMPSFENMEKFGYTMLLNPIRSLVISFPIKGLSDVLNKQNDELLSESLSIDTSESILENKIPSEPIIEEEEEEEIIFTGSQNGGFSIKPDFLTGKLGLERMMDFVDTNTNPAIKGQFEYKQETLSDYGKIFSYDLIGRYSAKIKKILDCIYDQKNNIVSEGIILVYSQYIDGGLIPLALALEEFGFTRYGDSVKPLFKKIQTPVIDVRTMKPPTNPKDFKPARYTIISGDRRLTPNADSDVKHLTNVNNLNGEKVKIVLISKAGSEGIDFKFIRQVHILDPWYNLNRIEQIIGRGVRNFSHKDLPFEKRNVEIFLHGTIIGKENTEEAADLYIYRFAEMKAKQIGKVTRVLKESAVDCLLNMEQNNFSQEVLTQHLKVPIKQILSNNQVINNFKIGDAPFSPMCDYMESCNFNCTPSKEITNSDINMGTYNEYFIHTNNEKIVKKIKYLFKETFFYKKDTLISYIKNPVDFPLVQIYASLNQLINDDTQLLYDKYNRPGNLININEYYLFQPSELKYKNISRFDRVTPIDYKNSKIIYEQDNNSIQKVNREELGIELNKNMIKPKIIQEVENYYTLFKQSIDINKVERGDNDWYKHTGFLSKELEKFIPGITINLIDRFVVSHILESLLYNEKKELLNYLYSDLVLDENKFLIECKNYFNNKIIHTEKYKFIILYKLNEMEIYILENNKWTKASPEDQREIAKYPITKEKLSFKVENYNNLIGFLGYKKKNTALLFKTKALDAKRDTGAICEESGKEKSIQKLNSILGKTIFTNENTKAIKEKGKIIREALTQVDICILQEMALRYFNATKKNNKKWFLTPELAIYFKLYKVFV